MDLITQYPLGDDIAVTLLVLAVLSILALIAGAVVPGRLRHDDRPATTASTEGDPDDDLDIDLDDDEPKGKRAVAPRKRSSRSASRVVPAESEDSDEVTDLVADPGLARRLGAQLSTIGVVTAGVGIPVAVLAYLVPGSTDQRILRAALLLAGLLLGPLAAWRGVALQVAGLSVGPRRREALVGRLGALSITGALALGVLPVVIAVWFLREQASTALIALAAGVAISALAVRVCSAPLETAGAASAVLVGTDENDLEAYAEDNLGAEHQLTARIVRHGGGRAADLVLLTVALAASGMILGVPVIAAEGILVVLLGLGAAMLTAAAAAVIPHRMPDGRERSSLRMNGLMPAVLGGSLTVAAAALWLPTQYKSLRFGHVGMGSFTDPAVAGPEPLPREQMVPQIEQAVTDMGQWVSVTDDSRDAGAFLDVLTLHTVSPSAVVAGAIALGAVAALAALLLMDTTGERRSGTVLRAARTSRTGGALGTAAALGSTALTAALALGLVLLVLVALSVLSAGVPGLALALVAYAGLGALVVTLGFAGSLAAPALLDRRGTSTAVREAAASAGTGPRTALLLVAALAALPLLGPIVAAVQAAPRAATVWEDRALHALTPQALPLLAGIGLGVVTVLLVTASLLDASRRAGAAAVVETRASMLASRDRVLLDDLTYGLRRAAITPLALAVLAPVVAGFGFGVSALPGFVAGLVLAAAGLGLWAHGSAAAMNGAADLISAGRYGGPGSWGHSGALGGAVLTGVLRSSIGSVAPALLLTGTLVSAVTVPSMVGIVIDSSGPFLRWGVAVVALVIAGTCWVASATAPEVDLEDELEESSRPLFARRGEEDQREDTLDAMDWDDDSTDKR